MELTPLGGRGQPLPPHLRRRQCRTRSNLRERERGNGTPSPNPSTEGVGCGLDPTPRKRGPRMRLTASNSLTRPRPPQGGLSLFILPILPILPNLPVLPKLPRSPPLFSWGVWDMATHIGGALQIPCQTFGGCGVWPSPSEGVAEPSRVAPRPRG